MRRAGKIQQPLLRCNIIKRSPRRAARSSGRAAFRAREPNAIKTHHRHPPGFATPPPPTPSCLPPFREALKIFRRPSQRHSVVRCFLIGETRGHLPVCHCARQPLATTVHLTRRARLPSRATAAPENVHLTAKVTRSNAPTPRSLFRVAGSRTNNICRALIPNPRERRRFDPPLARAARFSFHPSCAPATTYLPT